MTYRKPTKKTTDTIYLKIESGREKQDAVRDRDCTASYLRSCRAADLERPQRGGTSCGGPLVPERRRDNAPLDEIGVCAL